MKKTFLILLISTLFFGSAFAQKFAYIDSQYILKNLDEFATAQKQLDELSVQWQQEIEVLFGEIDHLYRAYQAENILLTEEMRINREQEIIDKEGEAKELQKKRFGDDGDLYKKQEELIKPIQDKIYNAVQGIAEQFKYAIIFDKSSDLMMLFADPRYDKSDDVLDKIEFDY